MTPKPPWYLVIGFVFETKKEMLEREKKGIAAPTYRYMAYSQIRKVNEHNCKQYTC